MFYYRFWSGLLEEAALKVLKFSIFLCALHGILLRLLARWGMLPFLYLSLACKKYASIHFLLWSFKWGQSPSTPWFVVIFHFRISYLSLIHSMFCFLFFFILSMSCWICKFESHLFYLKKSCEYQVKQPILFLSGLQDEMVPPSHMQILYAKAAARNNRCLFVEFPSGMHMDTWLAGGDDYWKTVQDFLAQHAPEKRGSDSSSNNDGNIILWLLSFSTLGWITISVILLLNIMTMISLT